MSEDRFPKNISLGANSVGWIEEEIELWIDEHIALSREVNHE